MAKKSQIIHKSLFLAAAFFLSALSSISWAQKVMGFGEENAKAELAWESELDALIDPKNMDTWMQFLSAQPHHVGSVHDKKNADFIANLFRSWGYETQIVEYYVLFPTPRTRVLELLGSKPFIAKLEEPALKEDRTSGQKNEQLPSYNAYSSDGDVTSELVFVNRGVPADYEELEKMGVSVKGKIVIAKYGGSWRGIKPKVAAEHGAIGCIIYSDPDDDGYGAGDVYPEGPFRPKFGVQRGSVKDEPVFSGDPLTPGRAATKNAKRLKIRDAETIMRIPVLPISYEDALPLLEALRGPVAPESWRGGLPVTYHVGPSKDRVHLKLEFNWDIKPIYNVIAQVVGSEFPDEWVIRGNHHDAWVNGATDPVSGLVAMLEEARAISELIKKGYKLRRTLIFCAWDGEEPGLLGSTEWGEDHKDELKKKAVVYINSDSNSRGFIRAGGSHTLELFFNEVADTILDPQTKVSIKERAYARRVISAEKAVRKKEIGEKNVRLTALGSGSDYAVFLQHIGIASMNLGFAGEARGGEYHSIYDSYDDFIRFKDPGFQYGVALSKTGGRVVMRIANAEILPLDFSGFYKTVAEYVSELNTLSDTMRSETETENGMIREKMFDVANDRQKNLVVPTIKDAVPFFNFSDLENVMIQLKNTAAEFGKLYGNGIKLPPNKRKELNNILLKAERSLLSAKGLPRRDWYKHQIYEPGFYTGYDVKTLPGIREGLEQRNWKEAQEYIKIVAKTLENFEKEIAKANAILEEQ